MTDTAPPWLIPHLIADAEGRAHFVERPCALNDRAGMLLSESLPLGPNMRLRTSVPGYATDWHVSTEPVLIIILAGTLRIITRNRSREFVTGDHFIADDVPTVPFDATRHGHRAEVVGVNPLRAIHVKLRPFETD